MLLADGNTQPIGEIDVSDWVVAADPETGERGPRQVTAVWVHQDQLVDLEIGDGTVTTTEDHPFWNVSDREWQRADELDAGESLLTAGGDLIAVGGMDWATRTGGIAYNLSVADLHTYFVVVGDQPALVHNTCKPDPDPSKCKLPDDIAKTFEGGHYETETLTSSETLYRVYSDEKRQLGMYWTDIPPSPDSVRQELALPPQNAATDIVTIEVPAGTTIHKGVAGPNFGHLGGGSQVVVWPEEVGKEWVTSCEKLR